MDSAKRNAVRLSVEWRNVTLCLVLILLIAHLPCTAAEGGSGMYWPGYRNYLTGIVPRTPGLYFRNDLVVYSANAPRIPLNGLPVADASIDAVVDIFEPYYVWPHKLFGANHATVLTPSLVWDELDGDIIGTELMPSGSHFGMGDTALSPLLLGWHKGDLHYNTNLAIFIPTGDYSIHRAANTGRNFWALDPEFGITQFNPKTGWDLSGAVGYTFNFENPDTNYRSGNVAHLDFAVGKLYRNGIKPGIVGYAWVQTTPDSGEGAIFGSFESRVFGIGPAVQWKTGQRSSLMFRYFHEFGAKDHLEGDQLAFSFRTQF